MTGEVRQAADEVDARSIPRQNRRGSGRRVLALDDVNQLAQPICRDLRVVVEKRHEIGVRGGDSGVVGASEAPVARQLEDIDVRMTRTHVLDRAITRTVIDYDDPLIRVVERLERGQAIPEMGNTFVIEH